MATAKIPVRLKGQTTCANHKGRQLDFYCEECHELICPKCISNNHKRHLICELSELTPKKNQEIRNFIENTERIKVVEVKTNITYSNTMLQENDRTFETLSKQLMTQTNKLKKDLDALRNETLSLYQIIKDDNIKLIQKYKQQLEIYDKQLDQQLQECKRVLQQGSHIEIYDTECEIDFRLHFPAKPALGTASFIPNQYPDDLLELAIGKYESVSADHGLQAEPPCIISSICPTTDDQAWTSNYSDTLTLLDRKDVVIQKVTHTVGINDISLSPTTHRLWVCDEQNNILELVSGQLTKTFKSIQKPKCICVTTDNNIIIGMSKHITTQGQVVLTTTATGKPLVCSPFKITECPITNNVAVIDGSDIDDGGDGNSYVIVMDSTFQKLFLYRGEKTPHRRGERFDRASIVYDSKGNIIVNDWASGDIFILNGTGELLKTLSTDSGIIGVDSRDILWLVYRSVLSEATKRFLLPLTLK